MNSKFRLVYWKFGRFWMGWYKNNLRLQSGNQVTVWDSEYVPCSSLCHNYIIGCWLQYFSHCYMHKYLVFAPLFSVELILVIYLMMDLSPRENDTVWIQHHWNFKTKKVSCLYDCIWLYVLYMYSVYFMCNIYYILYIYIYIYIYNIYRNIKRSVYCQYG